jgi:polysaccharide biosynthesis/export protein
MAMNDKSIRVAALLAAWLVADAALAQAGLPLPLPVDAGRTPAVADPTTAPTTAAASAAPSAAPVLRPGEPQPLTSLSGVGADYRIGPNDLLDFELFGLPDMKRTVRVNSSGSVSLPLVGSVPLAGLTAQQAEDKVAQLYARDYLQNPHVSLFIREFTTQRITIEGAVAKPGIYPVTGQLTLLRALALAGGGAPMADLSEIMLYRLTNGQTGQPLVFDLDKIRAGKAADPLVLADDVIVVKRDPARTAVRDSLFTDIIGIFNPFN